MKRYDYTLVVGRFQPFHKLHKQLLDKAIAMSDKTIVVLGSSHAELTTKNPFTEVQREQMIRAAYPEDMQERLIFAHIRDYNNDYLWLAEIQNIANRELSTHEHENKKPTMAVVGHFKDGSSYYLNLFPQWKLERFDTVEDKAYTTNATTIREIYFSLPVLASNPSFKTEWEKIAGLVPESTLKFLEEYLKSEEYIYLRGEFDYNNKYGEDFSYKNAPKGIKPVFTTTDAVVTAMGHVLVVRRGRHPGKGKLAFPGGFLAEGYRLVDNAIKELKEETRIRVDALKLKKSIVKSKVFDEPKRSLRGRTITYAYHIELEPSLEEGLPTVKGGDDAADAFWMPIADAQRLDKEWFEDHQHILAWALGFQER